MKTVNLNTDVKLENGKKVIVKEFDDEEGKILTREYLFFLVHSFLIISSLGYGYYACLQFSLEYGLKCLFYGVVGIMSFLKTRKIYFIMHLFYVIIFYNLNFTYLFQIVFYGGFGIYYLCNLCNADITNDVLVLASAFYAVVFLAINYLVLFLICKAHDILLESSK